MATDPDKIKRYLPTDDELEQALQQALSGGESSPAQSPGIAPRELQDVRPEALVKGRVLLVNPDRVTLDIGYKCEGIIDTEEFGDSPPAIGDEVEALVVAMEDENGEVTLSIEEAQRQKIYDSLKSGGADCGILKGTVRQAVKGGLIVDIGVRAFMPAREADLRYVEDLEELVGKTVEVEVVESDPDRERVVVSRRAVLKAARERLRGDLYQRLEVGQVVEGRVSSLTDFGAFVDLGGADGLIFKSDLAWGQVKHPKDVLSVDQVVKVTVLSIDAENDKIGLGLKQGGPSPWDGAEERYKVGTRHSGCVKSMLDFGVIVETEPGVEGLCHISEMSWTKHIKTPAEKVRIGEEVDVEVIALDLDKHKISFSMKKVEANPWDNLEQRYPFATIVKGQVSRVVDFGAFVELPDGVEGLVHVSEISWSERYERASEALEPGQAVTAIVIGADEDRHRLSLSIRKTTPDPWWDAEEKFAGKTVTGVVKQFRPFGAFIEIADGLLGLLHISRIAGASVRPQEVLKLGQEVEVEVLEVDEEERRLSLAMTATD